MWLQKPVTADCGLQIVACVASIFVGFGSKERLRNGIFGVLPVHKMERVPKNERGGWERGRKKPLADKPLEFETSVCQGTELLIGWAQRLLSDSVSQSFRVLHCCVTVQQKSCSEKPKLHIISEANAFGRIIYIQILIIVVFLLRRLRTFPLKFQHFPSKFSIVWICHRQ